MHCFVLFLVCFCFLLLPISVQKWDPDGILKRLFFKSADYELFIINIFLYAAIFLLIVTTVLFSFLILQYFFLLFLSLIHYNHFLYVANIAHSFEVESEQC